jgi:hypothetical protein
MGIAERKFQAAQILDPSEMTVGGKELSVMEGTLFYKRHVRRSCCHSKGCVSHSESTHTRWRLTSAIPISI